MVSLIIQIAKKETEVKLKFQKVWFTELGIRIDLDMDKKVTFLPTSLGDVIMLSLVSVCFYWKLGVAIIYPQFIITD